MGRWRSRGLRPRGRPRQVPGRAGQAAGPRPGRHPRPGARRALRPLPRRPVHPVRRARPGHRRRRRGDRRRRDRRRRSPAPSCARPGVERIRIVDQAGGIGGTWYWNRYPGVMCDVESYIYLPMLEELGYVPTHAVRVRRGDPAPPAGDRRPLRPRVRRPVPHRRHPGRVGRGRRPLADPHRPRRRAHLPLLRAGRRDPQPAEAAGHPGHGGLRRAVVPHRPLGLRATPAAARASRSPSSATRSSALIGTGATGIQCLPPLAEAAKHVYVFQRTPSAIGVRGNRPTDPDFADGAGAGLAAGPDGQLPGDHARAGRSTRTSPTTGGRTTTPRSTTRPGARA